MAKKSLTEVFEEMEKRPERPSTTGNTPTHGDLLNASIERAFEVEPSADGPLGPAPAHTGDPGAQAPPLRGRPTHPYWRGEPLTESALRAVHLWPRAKPAPQAVAEAASVWKKVLAQSKAAYFGNQEGEQSSVDILIMHLAANYSALAKGGHPPIEMMREDWPDLSPTDPDRVRYDTAALMITKIEIAIAKAYDRGGAWRAAVEHGGTPA